MRLYKWIKAEVDVEFLTCTHGMVMMISYGFLRWLVGIEQVPFAVIFQMILLCYIIAWVQKALFLEDRKFPGREYKIRKVIWYLVPFLFTIPCDEVFGWFDENQIIIRIVFYGFVAFYFVMLRIFVKFLYQEDTKELNQLLESRKKKKDKGGNV